MKTFYYSVSTLLFLLVSNQLLAQNNELFTIVDPTLLNLTTAQQTVLNNMTDDEYAADWRIVEIGHLPDLMNEGQLIFSIPEMETKDFIAQTMINESHGEGEFSWAGEITNNSASGYIGIIETDDDVGGFIQTSDGTGYTFHPLVDRKVILVKHKPDKDLFCESDDLSSEIIGTSLCEEPVECNDSITLLILWTPNAGKWAYGESGYLLGQFYPLFAALALRITLDNSGLSDKPILFKKDYLDMTFIPQYGVSYAVEELRANPDYQMLRELHKADLTLALTYEQFPGAFGSAYNLIDSDYGVGIVEIPYIGPPRWTFPHEFGHFFRAAHEEPQRDCVNAHKFRDSDNALQLTCLHTTPRIEPGLYKSRIPHYSNPEVLFNGVPTGTIPDNNTWAIKTNWCTVASYRNFTGDDPPKNSFHSHSNTFDLKFDEVVLFPNPVQHTAYVQVHISKEATINFSLFNINGKRVKNILMGEQKKGNFQFELNLSDLENGLYTYRIEGLTDCITDKLIILR